MSIGDPPNVHDMYREFHERYPGEPKGMGWVDKKTIGRQYRQIEALLGADAWGQFKDESQTELKETSDCTLLDVGCGYGDFYGFMYDGGPSFRYTGIDTNPEAIDIARARHGYVPSERAWIEGNILDWKVSDVQFDYVVCIGSMAFYPEIEANKMLVKMWELTGRMLVIAMHKDTHSFPVHDVVKNLCALSGYKDLPYHLENQWGHNTQILAIRKD